MPSKARKEIVDLDEISVYHCISRCVRRAFLCGQDKLTGNDYGHRKKWVEDRLHQLVSVFMVELLAYTVLQNHYHVQLRIRPDLVAKLSDREVARRSLMISPSSMPDGVELKEPSQADIEAALQDKARLRKWRQRLGNLSWFMRYLNEPIARRANREDDVTGAFWDGRFRSSRLLDDFAATACSIYIDLNEIRARIAETPEASLNSTIGRRIEAWQIDQQQRSQPCDKTSRAQTKSRQKEPAPPAVAPVNVASDNGTRSGTMTEEQPKPHARRPSDSGYLPMTIEQYMELVDWAGRCVKQGKRGAIPAHVAPIMDRLVRNYDAFLVVVKNFKNIFRTFCGTPESLAAHAQKIKAKKMRGIRMARKVCGTT